MVPNVTTTSNCCLARYFVGSFPPAFVSNISCCSGTSRHIARSSHAPMSVNPPASAEFSSVSPRVRLIIRQSCSERQSAPLLDRKTFLRLTACVSLSVIPSSTRTLAEAQFSTYKGPISLGFSFSYPSSWTVTKKAIKTHLSEVIVSSKDDTSTTAGLVVDAVKIDSVDRFGTPEVVGQKVVDVEKKKDSVKDASVISASAFDNDGLTYYMIDYTVDSSRGEKRYIAKVTVTGNQLYVFTTQAKVDKFQGETADVFLKMLDSFNVKKQYS